MNCGTYDDLVMNQTHTTLCFDTKMADVSNNERKVKLTKNGKIIKRRLRNPEGALFIYIIIKLYAYNQSPNFY